MKLHMNPVEYCGVIYRVGDRIHRWVNQGEADAHWDERPQRIAGFSMDRYDYCLTTDNLDHDTNCLSTWLGHVRKA